MKEKKIYLLRLVLLAVVLVSGCSKKPKEDNVDVKQDLPPVVKVQPAATVKEVKVSTERRVDVPRKKTVEKRKRSSEKLRNIRLCALLSWKGKSKAGLVNNDTGSSAIIKVGQVFSGYTLLEVLYSEEQVILLKDNVEYVVKISGDDKVEEGVSSLLVMDPKNSSSTEKVTLSRKWAKPLPEGIDISKLEVVTYEATSEERSLGIDPNDSATWKEGYRGPGIERVSKSASNPAVPNEAVIGPNTILSSDSKSFQEVLKSHPAPVYESTPEETAAGINPNDSSTWPQGYRGPGIERYLREHPEAAVTKGPRLTAPGQPRPTDN